MVIVANSIAPNQIVEETIESPDATSPVAQVDSKKRNWRIFSIRTLLILVAILAPFCAYVGTLYNKPLPGATFWDVNSGENIKWMTSIGSQSFSNPTVHDKYVFVGSNNSGFHPKFPTVDLGVMNCFEKATGKFLWQHTNQKLKTGNANDWAYQGVTSQAYAENNRVYYVSNRAEVVCLDTEGFLDSENDGPFVDEVLNKKIDADVVWKFDMIKELGVYPHNISHSNVVVDAKNVYLKTSNGVDPGHLKLANPEAPSFLVLDKLTGKVRWHDNSPGENILHGSWGSPTLATISGKRQVLFPGGDGWLYSFEPDGGPDGKPVLLWKFDCNPKDSKFVLGGTGANRNNILTAPTVHKNRIYLTMGQDPEHGMGPSRVWCIEPRDRRGDISPTTVTRKDPKKFNKYHLLNVEAGDVEVPNPNSGAIWEFTGNDDNKDGKISNKEMETMSRSLSRVIVANDCGFVTCQNGFLYCLDLKTGKLKWKYDALSQLWTSPVILGELIYLTDEDGMVNVFKPSPDPNVAMPKGKPIATMNMNSTIYTNPCIEKGIIYLGTRNKLYAIEDPSLNTKWEKLLGK